MATTMSDHLLEHLARWSAERSETQLAEEACELMLLRTSRLGWPNLVYSYSCPRCRHNMVEVLD